MVALFTVVATIALVVAPVSAGATTTKEAASPKSGGTLQVVMNAEPAAFDPAIAYVYTSYVGPQMALIFGQLCTQNPKTGAVQMYMAKSLTPSQDSKVWTLVLNPNMKFSDGTPFDASAVQFNIARDADPAVGSAQAKLAKTLTMSVTNPTTLQITLPATDTTFNADFCQDFPFVGSPTAIQAQGMRDFGQHPVGAGPFKLQTWNHGTSISFVKNPMFSSFAPNQPYLNGVNIQLIPAVDQEINALTTGQAQFGAFATAALQIAASLKPQGYKVPETAISGGGTLVLNNKTEPFNDPIARRALNAALNRTVEATTFSPGSPPVEGLFAKTSPFYNPKYKLKNQDKALAQKLFNQYAKKHGKPVTFTLSIPALPQPQINAAATQSTLAGYKNVKVTVATTTSAVYQANVQSGNFQVTNYAAYIVNPVSYVSTFQTGGSLNFQGWSNPIVDQALAAAKTAPTVALQKKQWNIVQQQFLKDMPFYLDGQNVFIVAYKPNVVTGVKTVQFGSLPLWGQISFVNP